MWHSLCTSPLVKRGYTDNLTDDETMEKAMIETSTPPTETTLDEQRLAEMRQQQRFDWFAARLAERADCYRVDELVEKLETKAVWPGQWEKAAVMLALKGTPEATGALEGLDTSQRSNSFRALYDKCLAEAYSRIRQAA